jgi:hypothetical protein
MINDYTKLRGKCDGCHKMKWLIRRRTVKLPLGNLKATSREFTCKACYNKLLKALGPNHG